MLIESYNRIFVQTKNIIEKIQALETEIKKKSVDNSGNISARIQKLNEQIDKIDDYLLRIKGFQELAKKNLDSQNVLTIEAPPGYRVNLNRLRNWAMMIDPQSSNDPYAQRVYVVSKCDQCFLEKKKKEFSERIEQLNLNQETGNSEEIEILKSSVQGLREELKHCALGKEILEFSKDVVGENNKYWYQESPSIFVNHAEPLESIAPGAYAASLPFEKEQRIVLKNIMGNYYDSEGGRVLLPVEINNKAEYVMTITCTPSKRKKLDRALQNFMLNTINGAPAGMRKVFIIDGVRFNSSSMGSLRQLEDTFVMGKIPRNPEQLTATLEQIVSSFADMDETIEQYDSVTEYNAAVEPSKRLALATIVLFGWPTAFEGHDRELIQRIMTNYERYGISLITVGYRNTDKKDNWESKTMPEYALQNAIHISMMQGETTITFADSTPQKFTWYYFSESLSGDYINSVKKNKISKETIGNEYPKRYSLDKRPEYIREYKKIELPFGIDSKGIVHSISFENENFATYLVGASRSGKSTLLHTLITGLIRNYHPDNVELWLADFKQLEFKKYIDHCPAHVKYILLDESTELVYDLIDKLTNKMLERQRLFAKLGKERIDQIDVSSLKEPLPVIFVILDEFSIMSQSIAESESYRIRLQNLLAKGAALGIKFLFSSQTFTTGVAGLTPTARAQIQQRIAMKGTKDEISETLELSSNIKTEQVVNWMDALPPHYALVKHRISADTLPEVNRVLVMYIPDYSLRDKMIDDINTSLSPVNEYNPKDIRSYVKKSPVIVDGNSYESFESRCNELKEWMNHSPECEEYTGDELFLNVGTPRRMEAMLPIVLAPETRENIMLIADNSEMVCVAAVICSVMKSFLLQGAKVHIWAYGRNRLYRIYKDVWEKYAPFVDMDAICNQIKMLKRKIQNQEEGQDIIIFMGMERICSDFEFTENNEHGKIEITNSPFEINNLIKSGVLIEQEENAPDLFEQLLGGNTVTSDSQSSKMSILEMTESENKSEEKEETNVYNAMDDFLYILRQGSRLGYHFMTVFNSLADFKQSGVKDELFRHRMAFQIPKDDSWEFFGSGLATTLPEHVCRYSNAISSYSFRPYLHREFCWDGWTVNEQGIADNSNKGGM